MSTEVTVDVVEVVHDDDFIASIVHGLGTEDVVVETFAGPDRDVPIGHAFWSPITRNEIEVCVSEGTTRVRVTRADT